MVGVLAGTNAMAFLIKSKRDVLVLVVTGLGIATGQAQGTCLDGVDVAMFSQLRASDLGAPPRDTANDALLNAFMKAGLDGKLAGLTSIDGSSREEAARAAAGRRVPLLAYLLVDAASREIPGYGANLGLVDVRATRTLQLLRTGDAKVLGEASSLGKTPALDVSDALGDLLSDEVVGKLGADAIDAVCALDLSPKDLLVAAADPPSSGSSVASRELVTKIQHALIAAGYDPGFPDGKPGPKTRAAVKEAELALKLPIKGELSEELLHELPALGRTLIYELQKTLLVLGRIDTQPSGVLESDTRHALEDAELQFGLPPDGVPDRDLLRLLRAQQQDRPTASSGAEDEPAVWVQLRVQELLIRLGYFTGPATEVATGASSEAIRRAEADLTLPVDGVADEHLLRVLEAKLEG